MKVKVKNISMSLHRMGAIWSKLGDNNHGRGKMREENKEVIKTKYNGIFVQKCNNEIHLFP